MLRYEHVEHILDFKFNAGTSRGILKQKETHFIKVWESQNPSVYGVGETGLFRGLSADDNKDFIAELLKATEELMESGKLDHERLRANPSILMGLEMALLDLKNKGVRKIFSSDFYNNQQPIPINGLVWMGEKEFMKKQIKKKLEKGFDCIKLKIGALDFDLECSLLRYIREEFSNDIILRVDANGAFDPKDALMKLDKLNTFKVHSIEQPIKANQWDEMRILCEKTPVPIALDEELIGISDPVIKKRMLEVIKPQFIILKPSLLGGFQLSEEWINLADSMDIQWWVTSALESNIGLNAIAQWTSQLLYKGPQGLGTGSLFSNNIDAPLFVKNGLLYYDKSTPWNMNIFNQ